MYWPHRVQHDIGEDGRVGSFMVLEVADIGTKKFSAAGLASWLCLWVFAIVNTVSNDERSRNQRIKLLLSQKEQGWDPQLSQPMSFSHRTVRTVRIGGI